MVLNVSIHDRFDPSGQLASGVPATADAMLRHVSATSEGFAYGSTALSAALRGRREATIAASLADPQSEPARLSCWRCDHDDQGIALEAKPLTWNACAPPVDAETAAAQLLGDSGWGDILIVCDPWGEHELLCRALRMASARGITTIAVTGDHPNLLAVLASHAVRVPVTPAVRRDYVLAALRHFVQTAGTSLVPASRRITGPLRTIEFV